jgi:hypothetical protein
MAFPPKKASKNIAGQGAIVRSLRKPKAKAKAPAMPACDCGPGESCPECAGTQPAASCC